MYCRGCGHELSENAKYCRICGLPVEDTSKADELKEINTDTKNSILVMLFIASVFSALLILLPTMRFVWSPSSVREDLGTYFLDGVFCIAHYMALILINNAPGFDFSATGKLLIFPPVIITFVLFVLQVRWLFRIVKIFYSGKVDDQLRSDILRYLKKVSIFSSIQVIIAICFGLIPHLDTLWLFWFCVIVSVLRTAVTMHMIKNEQTATSPQPSSQEPINPSTPSAEESPYGTEQSSEDK